MSAGQPSQHIAIVGAGVIGLTTAIALLESSNEKLHRRVTIVSKDVPSLPQQQDGSRQRQPGAASQHQPWHILDPTPAVGTGSVGSSARHPATFASAWAGGHHVSDAKTEQEKRHDQQTFEHMRQLAKLRPWQHAKLQLEAEPLVWVHQTEYFEALKPDGSHPALGVLDWYPDFKVMPQAALPPGIAAGCTFSTLDINVPVYHSWLLLRFLELGGRLVHRSVSSVAEAIRLASSPDVRATFQPSFSGYFGPVDLLILSPGLGARTLKGLEDAAVHPHRGQVVLVNAPWLKRESPFGSSGGGGGGLGAERQDKNELPGFSIVRRQGGRETYTIPRGDGTVVCGGTRLVDDWDAAVRPETTRAILQRCLRVCPQLARPDRTLPHLHGAKVEDVEVLGVNVGLRPARKGGVRLERGADVDGTKVVYNYGYGGWGYQASWGAACEAKEVSCPSSDRRQVGRVADC
ncbi:related to D-amino acid oxidase [Pseudozyma flocculosa]|uniref:Related to D-amino acid oxidase n=1 Tax=Pseudozyma flocculosa TaxID=84751 RepID=A0A5C3F7W7_9BASI|nr:related to D-amino acid oxidase [Pseudozyma flocculosa]